MKLFANIISTITKYRQNVPQNIGQICKIRYKVTETVYSESITLPHQLLTLSPPKMNFEISHLKILLYYGRHKIQMDFSQIYFETEI